MQNDKEYWEKQFSNVIERKMKLAQASFFYKVFKTLLPIELKNEINKSKFSCCDFGCGLGNFTDKLYEIFPSWQIYGVDYSQNAISYAKKHFPNVSFINTELNKLKENFDIIISSNTLEHFSNPDEIIVKLLKHTKKFFILLIPFEERELYKEHLFSFEREFFKDSIENFELIYLKSIDLSYYFNTMWFGKQVLVVYKAKDYPLNFPKNTTNKNQYKLNLIDKINRSINLFRRNVYRQLRKFITK